ncbi:hypothetical protein DFH08DRAFT_858123 [Mycena albidolilacea]|uniref:Tetratricopeptide repeat protein n=1 Tax=Mycena albidolilacea TaxID=1033008 RepID=A0AAD7A8I9_9AGAR|nr:hypothetical protein DFH08DRAFT_858123 [Mycena albidolilacea]
MLLKDELRIWQAARNAFDAGNYEQSLELFGRLPRSATISTNMGLLSAGMGDHEKALSRFTDATTRDPYLTISYFQRGVSHFLLERYRPAGRDFKRAWLSLRGNEEINYEQLGLPFRLFASEVLFNLGLSRIRLGRMDKGMEYLEKAKSLTMIDDHDIIEDVLLQKGEGFTVYSIAPGVLYWPSEIKLKSIERKDFMGEATLIAATDLNDLTTGFYGLQLKAALAAQAKLHKENLHTLEMKEKERRRQRNLHRQSKAVVARRVTLVSIRSPSTIRTDGTDAPLPPRRSVDDERRAEEEMRLP